MSLILLSACKQESPVEPISEEFNIEARDSRKFPIEPKLAEILINGDKKQIQSILPEVPGYENVSNSRTSFIIMCYTSPYDGGKDCFAVWGTNDCGDVFCEAGCECTPITLWF